MSLLQALSKIFVKTFTLLCVVFLISDRKTSVDSRTARGATYLQCPAECSCLGNVVDCSKRALTAVPKSLPDWVESLDLCSNSLKSIDVDAFVGLDRLSEINLSDNPVEEVNCSTFQQLPKLTGLKLAHCRLAKFPYCDVALNISHLSLNHNDIAVVESAVLTSVADLRSLDLSYNKVTRLNNAFPFMPKLHHLFLNNNLLLAVDRGVFDNLISLEWLKLNKNRIHSLQKNMFSRLGRLKYLISWNITSLIIYKVCFSACAPLYTKETHLRLKGLSAPSDPFILSAAANDLLYQIGAVGLEVLVKHFLELERNRIRLIDGLVFHGLDNLISLKLKRNVITELMDGAFWGLSRIQILDLSHNNISSVSNKWLYGLESLLELSLAHNQITQVSEDCWRFCQHLIQLDLSHNQLSSLSSKAFEKLESLQQLFISHNYLSVIADESFSTLSTLLVLGLDCLLNVSDLSFNEISWSVEDKNGPFHQLTSLTRLSLQHNLIKSIGKQTFQGLGKLRQLHLDDNNISSIQANAFETLKELREFHLNSSQFLCDCQLSWLKRWLNEAGFQSTVVAQCEYPELLKERNVLDLVPTDFKCVNFPKPIITHEPESHMAIKHGNVTLTCQAATGANSPLTIEWKKDNVAVTGANIATTVTGPATDEMVHVSSVLHIWPVLDIHAGSYQCIASNVLGTSYSTKAMVTVSVFPTFLKTPTNVVVKSGTTARLDCAATGSPQPEISLQKDGGDDFPAARERRMHIFPSDEMFFIVDIKSEDQGLYTCIAKNDVGVITANASLQVLEAPSFVKHMENKVTLDGDTTVMECMTSGSPKPRLEWLKDGIPLQPTLRHFFTADDQLLVIVQTQSSDAGEYTCIMTNTLGSERQTSRLTVLIADGDTRSSVEESTTTGIIIIAVVCCVVGTSLIWVIVIYKTRQRQKGFRGDRDKRLASVFRTRACHDGSLANVSVQGLYCPIQTSGFGTTDVNGTTKCPQYRHNPMTAFPSDTEDEEGEEEAEQRYSYCLSHHHEARLPEEQQVCRHRSDSGTHTASSSLSSCTNNSHSLSEPLQSFQPFTCGPTLQPRPLEKTDTAQTLAVVHVDPHRAPSHHTNKHTSPGGDTFQKTGSSPLDSEDFAGEERRRFSSFVSGESLSASSLQHQNSSSSLPEMLTKTEIHNSSLNEQCDDSSTSNNTPLCVTFSKDSTAQQGLTDAVGNYLTVETNS